MNVFRKVTLESLKKNRTRTAVTIIGIMLSTALMTAVTTSVSSLQHFLMEDEIARNGKYHASNDDVTAEEYNLLADNEQVTEITYAEHLGYADAGSSNTYKPYLYILAVPANFTDLASVTILSGEMPSNSSELLIPEHLAVNGGVYYDIGDTITLEIGDRLAGEDPSPLTQHHPFNTPEDLGEGTTPEHFVPRFTKTYTICGIYERPGFEEYSAPGYSCLTIDEDGVPAGNLDLWYTIRHPKQIYDFMTEIGLQGNSHTNLLMYMGISRFDGYISVLYGMTAILIGLIVFGSVSLIYNAFAISVSERTKQFGLLSSVGATRKQLRYMVRFEAFCVSAVGIPLGLLLGIAGVAVTLLCVGSKFSALFSTGSSMRIHVSWTALIVSLIVSILTVRISAWIPSRRATRISAVEAIRQSKDIKAERRPIRTPKWIYKLFGLPGMLGQKYFKRSRKKYRATVLSLFMSVVLFISAASFSDNLQHSVVGIFGDQAWDLRFWSGTDETAGMTLNELKSLFTEDENVEQCAAMLASAAYGTIPVSQLSEDAEKSPECFMTESLNTQQATEEAGCYVMIEYVDDASFRDMLRENHLSEAEFMDASHPQAVALDKVVLYNSNEEKYQELHLLTGTTCDFRADLHKEVEGCTFAGREESGDYIYLTEDGEPLTFSREECIVERQLHAGAVLKERPYFVESQGYIVFLYPFSAMETILDGSKGDRGDRPDTISCLMTAPDHAAAYKTLRSALVEHHMATGNLYDLAAERENERNLITIIKVFSYSFVVLISLIAAANVFNSISTNIALRRREFAMLRSIGMSGRGLQSMMNYECILYGTRALLFGLPVSFGVSYLIFMVIHEGFESGFRMPWSAMGFAVFSVFAVVFASMLYAMSKIKRDNPMDALKNENL